MTREAIFQALVIAALLGLSKFIRDLVIFKTQIETRFELQIDPLVEWWKRTAIDALKIATNPTSQRLAELADKYIASVTGEGRISISEKQELIDGLRAVMNDKDAHKRQSASMSLRFIESREKVSVKDSH